MAVNMRSRTLTLWALRDQVCYTVDRPCFEIRADLVEDFVRQGVNSRARTENNPAVFSAKYFSYIKPA